MNCPKCGSALKDTSLPCPNCGKKMTDREIKIEKMLQKRRKEEGKKKNNFFRDLGTSYINYWLKIFDIKSLTGVKEFWYGFMLNLIIAVLGVVAYLWIGVVYAACMSIPMVTSMIRRIKDTGREWFYFLLVFLPGAGFVVLIVLLSLPSYYTPKVVNKTSKTKK